MTKDPRVCLAHILERASRIEAHVRDGHAAFMGDPKTHDAVIRRFEFIGEAATRVPPEYRAEHPSTPWQLMGAFRDVLIHGHEGADLGRVWTTAARDLPAVRAAIAATLPAAPPARASRLWRGPERGGVLDDRLPDSSVRKARRRPRRRSVVPFRRSLSITADTQERPNDRYRRSARGPADRVGEPLSAPGHAQPR